MGLPAIPALEHAFPDAAGRGPLTLSLFLVGFAVSPLLCGPVADRFGRRPTLLGGLVLFLLAAAACTLAPSFNVLLGFRLVQGLAAGGCVILPIAIVRDLFEGAAARHRLSQVTAVLGIGPMAAPILGGWVMDVSTWRVIYAAQAVAGLVLLLVTWRGFSESLPDSRRRALNPVQMVGSYRAVLGNRSFRGFALTYAFGFAGLFAYISGAPSVLMDGMGLSAQQFALLFALTSCGVLLGSLLSGRLSRLQVSSRRIMATGSVVMFAAALGSLALAVTETASVATLMPLVALVIFCFGLMAPSANHEALHGLPHVAGAAAGMLRCAQMVTGAIASALIAFFEPFGHPALAMSGIMAAAMAISLAILVHQLAGDRRLPAEA